MVSEIEIENEVEVESTKTLKRTDVHRPSAINPNEYEWVAFELIPIGRFGGDILGDCEFLKAERNRIRFHMERTGGTYSRHEHGGNCMVCGSPNAVYTVLFYHEKTNSYIRMGQDCAQKCEMAMGGNIDAFKNSVKDAMELRAGKKKAHAILDAAGLSAAWDIYQASGDEFPLPAGMIRNEHGAVINEDGTPLDAEQNRTFWKAFDAYNGSEEKTVADIVAKLVKYGDFASDRQKNFLEGQLRRIANREVVAARRKAEYEAASVITVPTGERVEVVGKVISLKMKPTSFGDTLKMVVLHDTGWKVYGTVPANLTTGNNKLKFGDRISFRCTVKSSPDDPKFGFFSRPACAEIVQAASPSTENSVA